jgi:hypothetical protein
MLIVALVLAVIGLAALVTAVVTSNELIAWVCIAASVIGVLLLIVDALRERNRSAEDGEPDVADRDDETTVFPAVTESQATEDYPEESTEVADAHTKANAIESEPSEAETSAVEVEKNHDADAEAKRD